MCNKREIKISVRNLVEFILRSGDLDISFRSMSRAVEGTRAHQKVQKSKDENYQSEVTLKHSFEYKGFIFMIEGRADGIIKERVEDSIQIDEAEVEKQSISNICIDEIKSTNKPLERIDENHNQVHWAQVKCYAYIYCLQNKLDTIDVQLTYFHLETEVTKCIRKKLSLMDLEEFFYNILDKYIVWANFTFQWTIIRNNSVQELVFPFDKYRIGQRELAISVYRTIRDGQKIFVQAPTGIGKTISTLFPTVKAFSEGHTSKVFYLTAKTIARQVAEEAFKKMRQKGLRFKTLTLTAKDKICFKEESRCAPEYCEYANGHFDRVNDALLDILNNEDELSRAIIEVYSKKYNICPFEFSLDLAIWADCVICDFNYVFDPRVYLRRFFDFNGNDYTFLIDEAHNLVDRSREMFSATLFKKSFLDLKRVFKDKEPKIAKALNKVNTYMLKMKKLCGKENFYIQKKMPNDIIQILNSLMSESEEFLAKKQGTEGHKELLELFFEALSFTRILELYDDRYVTYVEKDNRDIKLKIFCLDPSYLLSEAVKRGKASVFFSATLSPIEYFKDILGGNKNDKIMILPSPFDKKNLLLMIASNVSTRYKDRENSYNIIADYIEATVSNKKGNYMVFFPSYRYMKAVYERFTEKHPRYNTIIQTNTMTEEEREEYLNKFRHNPRETLISFAVMGGIFSEGVDLKGDRLSGAIIIGVGLPQICLERNIIKDYFNERNNKGFNYAYMYPGMNKVLQSAGRVIRTEKDRGIVLLIDDRFSYNYYKRIFPKEWRHNIQVFSPEHTKIMTTSFWYNSNS
ncbi:ATP-dependent DNA helicase [Paramaledivibacter caminithermalis]|uniref:Rad3-related DNA helicase n=1 Tax=Paramaledivibacter caminithermalis (strain DSM 15212 / CIP 107654 / DViRD3) TaxID=1121301 RepID=A0A1M6K184_PARC5|nr:ATP-dependent DNA helicase [Paramaledivibacter caminithermalis]SHJ52675.1 Rad3-related DNA helicase [Paramaledivibacter caminithermalis DSM 15212]